MLFLHVFFICSKEEELQLVTGTEEEENMTLLVCLEKPQRTFSLKS